MLKVSSGFLDVILFVQLTKTHIVVEVVNCLWVTGIDEHFLVPNTPA